MLKQPVGQKRLTNVALIKFKVSKKNFEIACYKNKAINWRNGIEKDLNEVLQTHAIYRKADLGEQASKEELDKYFPGMKFDDIVTTILEKGELDIGDKERDEQKELMFKDIANLIAERIVHPDSKRPFSVDSITSALEILHFAPRLDQPVKKQASDYVKKLHTNFYVARAQMKIKIVVPINLKSKVQEDLEAMKVKMESVSEDKGLQVFVFLIDPSLYRPVDELIKKKLGEGSVEILNRSVMNREVTDLENAQVASLQKRDKPLEESKEDDSDNEDHKPEKGGSKKKKKINQPNSTKVAEEEREREREKEREKDPFRPAKEDIGNKVSDQSHEPKVEKKFKCTSCKDASFDTNQEFRTHFKTDWHNFNLKRKIDKKETVSEEDFLDQLLDEDLVQKR